jgi:hypothetical protein
MRWCPRNGTVPPKKVVDELMSLIARGIAPVAAAKPKHWSSRAAKAVCVALAAIVEIAQSALRHRQTVKVASCCDRLEHALHAPDP